MVFPILYSVACSLAWSTETTFLLLTIRVRRHCPTSDFIRSFPTLIDPHSKLGNYAVTLSNGTLTVIQGTAVITLGNLSQPFNGTSRIVTATSNPPNLSVNLTYDGDARAPIDIGTYAVVATINDANYVGSANGTLNIFAPLIFVSPATAIPTSGKCRRCNSILCRYQRPGRNYYLGFWRRFCWERKFRQPCIY